MRNKYYHGTDIFNALSRYKIQSRSCIDSSYTTGIKPDRIMEGLKPRKLYFYKREDLLKRMSLFEFWPTTRDYADESYFTRVGPEKILDRLQAYDSKGGKYEC